MRKRSLLLVAAAVVFVFGFYANNAKAGTLTLGGNIPVDIPIGDFGDGAGIGIGFLASGEYSFTDMIGATLELGYIHHLEKNYITQGQVPIMLGSKFRFGSEALVPYAEVQLGLIHHMVTVDLPGWGSASDSDDNFAIAFGGGVMYYFSRELGLNVGARFMSSDVSYFSDTMQIMLNVGVVYSLFL